MASATVVSYMAMHVLVIIVLDPDIMDSAELVGAFIILGNEWLKGIEAIKTKDYTHIMKIVTPNTKTAERILREGFNLSYTKISPQQCELEKYTHIQICYKCYKFEDHPTHQCTAKTQYCSEYASQEHTYQHCTNTFKKCLNCQGPHRTPAAGCTYRKTIINQKRDDKQKEKELQTHNTYAEIAKHAIQQTNPPQHALTLTNHTHLKLTALIFEAHIAVLDKTQKFGDILSKSLKTNLDIDTTFLDRDSAAIFNFYYDKTGTQQPHTKQTLSQETQKSHEPYIPQEPLKPREQQSLSSLDISMDYNPQEPHVPSNKRRISDEIENSIVLVDNKYTLPVKLYWNINDDDPIPETPSKHCFASINKPILTASYEVAYQIANLGKPHAIGETQQVVLMMANIMLGKETEVKLSLIPLSNATISDRIEDTSKDILAQVVADLISSPAKFSLQLDETTDVSNLSQLAVFVCYAKDDVIKEDYLFCKPLTAKTKAADMKKFVDNFFKNNSLSWDMVSAVCSNGALAMLGRKSGFGSVLNRVFVMRVELALFLQEYQNCHVDYFKNSEFILILAYLADIFAVLIHLNQKMQGSGVNIIEVKKKPEGFSKKLPLWKRRTENNNFANFPVLDECGSTIEDVSGTGDIYVTAELKQAIVTHLDGLVKSLDGYFPTRESYLVWVRQQFTFSVETTDANDEYLDEIIEIQRS
ncbi:hypothetical protein FHG87_007781 [Trinorchestia longiramus]|nr:hypothetical protein FHG87_007781 [Trinorchestia longiramus]